MKNMPSLPALFLVMSLTSAATSATAAADSDTTRQTNHPRQAQTNARLAHQSQRIHHEVKEGEISLSQAASLHQDDRQIRREERLMADQHGGHITRQEHRTLNQQENVVSAKIGK